MDSVLIDGKSYDFDSDCFIITSSKSQLNKIDEKTFLANESLFKKYELDRAFNHKNRFDNHQELIEIKGCVGYIPVMCTSIEQKKKSVYVTFLDRAGSFKMLMKGKRLIQDNWFDFNYSFSIGTAYVLKCESNEFYPDELRIIDYRKLK